ncbi:DUF4232 domain-containing protein [Streptomyces hoynatensis]|uniref:DUF4232 domain-containing protein n=1 Tax=Streptomyces hoynatensis TaxID=1141874 RepID=A0A3A9YQP1_9ACTN|nr:DUF4232 domain-containing protein [Streptomyces hoynatensis]RKN38280.1 DUF4232 domain-containing protein [Streptomyces hoynatensis]
MDRPLTPITDRVTGPRLRWAAFGCLLAGLLAGCGTERAGQQAAAVPPAPSGSSPASDPAYVVPSPSAGEEAVGTECPDDGVRLSPAPVDAALGLRATSILLTNCGEEPYPVEGYPLLRLLDEQGQPLDVEFARGSAGIAVVEGFDDPPQQVTLAPGETAEAPLLWRNTVTAGTPVNGAFLEVTPAEGLAPQRVRPDGGVDVGTTGLVGVGPWRERGGEDQGTGAAEGFDPEAGATERPGPD